MSNSGEHKNATSMIRIREFIKADQDAVVELVVKGLMSYGCREYNNYPGEYVPTITGLVSKDEVRRCFDEYVEGSVRPDMKSIEVRQCLVLYDGLSGLR